MENISQSIQVYPVLPNDRSRALDLVFDHLKKEERSRQIETIQSAFAANEISMEGLLGAYRSGVLVGAIFSQLMPGKNAQVWLPRLIQNADSNTSITLLKTTVQWLNKCQVRMAQLLLESVTADQEDILREAGFDYLTDLLYLVCPEDDFPHTPLSTALQFETYSAENHDRLARVVDATYQGTLDS